MAYEENELAKAKNSFTYSHLEPRENGESDTSYRNRIQAYRIENNINEFMIEERYSLDFVHLISIIIWYNTSSTNNVYNRLVFETTI